MTSLAALLVSQISIESEKRTDYLHESTGSKDERHQDETPIVNEIINPSSNMIEKSESKKLQSIY